MQVEGLYIRRAEPDDCSALHEIFSCPKVFAGTLQLPYPSLEQWRQRLADSGDGTYNLVAVVGDRVVGTCRWEHHRRGRAQACHRFRSDESGCGWLLRACSKR